MLPLRTSNFDSRQISRRAASLAFGLSMLACSPVAPARAPGTDGTATGASAQLKAVAESPRASQPQEDVLAGESAVPAPVSPTAGVPAEAASPPVVTKPIEPREPPPLPVGTTVLHIGDSFAGALGLALSPKLKAMGIRSILKHKQSTYIPTWAWGKELTAYMWKYHPDLVLITLGANELLIVDPESRTSTIAKLNSQLRGRPCVWIGPPLWEGAKPDLLEVIRKSAPPCRYLDSTALVPDLPRGSDKIHPTKRGRAIWADAVIRWLEEERVPNGETPWDLKPDPESAPEDVAN